MNGTPDSTPETPETTEQQQQAPAFGAFAFERVLSEPQCRKVRRVQERLTASLDGTVYVWVRDARPFAHGRDSTVETFTLRLHTSLPVAEVRDRVQEKFETHSSYREHIDGPLELFFGGRLLEDGKLLAEYLDLNGGMQSTQQWPSPFAGIMWVVPFRPTLRLVPHLWSA